MDSQLSKLSFRPGQSLLCKVEAPEPGGYSVRLLPSGVKGFLPSQDPLPIGREVPATFICMDKDRALLAFAFMIGTTERVQLSTDSDSENAFAVWADSYPRAFRQRRASDLVVPPLDGNYIASGDSDQLNASKLMFEIEEGSLTGCMKCSSEEELSRSAILFYRGRAVGSTYGVRASIDTYPVDIALKSTLKALLKHGTKYQLYELPEEIVLCMSSLFLGCPIEEFNPDVPRGDILKLLSFFKKRKQTAAIVRSLGEGVTFALSFVHKGRYLGSYYIERQLFAAGPEMADDLTAKYPNSTLDASFLPPEMTSDSVVFGYSLGAALAEAKR